MSDEIDKAIEQVNRLGTIERRTDGNPYRLVGILECNRCRKDVELWEDGDDQDDGSIIWSGCATGDCCSLLYADWWEGTFVYQLDQ